MKPLSRLRRRLRLLLLRRLPLPMRQARRQAHPLLDRLLLMVALLLLLVHLAHQLRQSLTRPLLPTGGRRSPTRTR